MTRSRRHFLAVLASAVWVQAAVLAQSGKAVTETAATPAPAAPAVATRTLRGTVVDAEKRPLAGATVRLIQDKLTLMDPDLAAWVEPVVVQTDAEGRFAAPGLARKAYVFRVEAVGYAATGGPVEPERDAIDVTLQAGHAVAGAVFDAKTRKPLVGARVLACDAAAFVFGEEACARATTVEGGAFRIEHLAEGTLALQARAAAHAVSDVQRIPLPRPEGAQELKFHLRAGARLAGRIVDGKGQPLPRRVVAFQAQHNSVRAATRHTETWPVVADPQGRFVHEGLGAGSRYTLQVKRPQEKPPAEAGPVEIQTGKDMEDFEIVVSDASTVLIRLVTPDEVGIAAVEVHVRQPGTEPGPFSPPGKPVPVESIAAGGEGRFTIEIFEEGRRSLLFVPADRMEVEREDVSLKAGTTVDLGTVVVEEGPTIAGRITDPEGGPVAGAKIGSFYTTQSGMRQRETTSRDDGNYRLGGLGEEPVMFLNVSANGYGSKSRQNVAPGETPVDFVLDPSGGVRGSVVLDGGGTPETFTIRLHPQATGGIDLASVMGGLTNKPESFSTTDGTFEMLDVAPGRYTVEARAADKAPGRRQGVEVVSRETTELAAIVLGEGISVRGRVVSDSDDRGVIGASILAQEKSGSLGAMMQRMVERGGGNTSDDDGRFALEGLLPGSYTLTIEHPDYAEARESVELAEDSEPAELLVRLKQGGGLTGTVRGAGGPVRDSRMMVFQNMFEMDRALHAATDAEGHYEIRRIPAGSYQVMRAPGEGGGSILNMKSKTAVIRDGEVTVVDFGDDARITLRGNVIKGGKSVGEAALTFMPSGGGSFTDIRSTRSDASGRYQLGLDQPGAYRVAVQPGASTFGGFDGMNVEIVVPDETEATRDIVLRASGAAGRVTDDQGNPLTRATVTAIRDDAVEDPWAQTPALTDSEGRYALDGLEDGTYRFTASADGFRSGSAHPVTIGGGTLKEGVDFQLSSGSLLRGVLLDPGGRGIEGAFVLAAPSGTIGTQGVGQAMTDVNGAFAVTAPIDGPVDLTAVGQGWAPVRRLGVSASTDPDDPGLVLHADAGGNVRVTVIDAEDRPAVGVQLQVRPALPYLGSELMQLLSPAPPTDPSGTTVATHLSPGEYTVAISGRADMPPQRTTVTAGGEISLSLRLP